MLLLILFAGCLTRCAAQTDVFPVSPPFSEPETLTMSPLEPIEATSTLQTTDSSDYVIVIFETVVQSTLELNETTVAPVLNQLQKIIQGIQPGLDFKPTLKKITKV